MRVVVTGRNGQLARGLAERTKETSEIDLVFLSRPDADLSIPGSMAKAIEAVAPDVIVNAAAYTAVDKAEDEPELAFRLNATGAGEVAEAARRLGVPVIQISTDYVFDGEAVAPYAEDAPVNPLNIYGASKLAGEEQVKRVNPACLIVRTSWIYSSFGSNFVRTMLAAARERESVNVVDDQRGCPTSALDLAGALLAVLDHWRDGRRTGFGETFHVAGSGTTSWYGLAVQVMEECQRLGMPAASVKPIASFAWPTRARRPRNSVLDCRKFVGAFGHRMPAWPASLSRVISRLTQEHEAAQSSQSRGNSV